MATSLTCALDLAYQGPAELKSGKSALPCISAGDLLALAGLSQRATIPATTAANNTLMAEATSHVAHEVLHQARFLHQSLTKTDLGLADYKLYARAVEPLEADRDSRWAKYGGPHFLTYSPEAGASVQGLLDLLQGPAISNTFIRANAHETLAAVQSDAAKKGYNAAM